MGADCPLWCMPSPSLRLPLLLAFTVALGVGGRMLRNRASGGPPDLPGASALDSQLASAGRADADSRGERSRRSRRVAAGTDSTTTARSRRRRGAEHSAVGDRENAAELRSERTPLGAITPEELARLARANEREQARVEAQLQARVQARAEAREGARRQGRIAALNARQASASGIASGGGSSRGRSSVDANQIRRPTSPIDLESASAVEIERLARVGPVLARRIVEDRLANGPFGSLAGLQRVRGVGPAMARQLQGHVTFGGAGRP